MTETILSRQLIPFRRRRRPFAYALALTLAGVGAVALLPTLHDAEASQNAQPKAVAEERAHDIGYHAHVPGSITLGELIERQREARRRGSTTVRAADLPAGEWQVQLGAFTSPASAERQLGAAQAQGLAGDLLEVRAAQGIYRLQSLPVERDRADALCSQLRSGGIDCFVRRQHTADRS